MILSPSAYIGVSIAVGLAFGILLQKARFCFVSAFRDFVAFKDTRVLKGLLAGIAVMTVFWSLQATFGYFRGFWTPAWGLGSLIGGFVFGLGMTLAGGCASGTLYRAGQGYLQFWLVLLFMFVGYVLFAFAFPVAETYYFQTLNPFEGQTLYLALPFSPAVTGALAVAVGTLAYAFVKGRSQLPDDPSGGTGVASDARAQVALGGSRLLSSVALGLRGIADGTVEYVRALRDDDRPLKVRLRDSWDARTAGVAMALVASLWFSVHGHWAITGSEARWAGYLLAGAGFDVASVDYWGSVLFRDGNISLTIDMLMIASLIVGSFIAAYASGDFRIRKPKLNRVPNYAAGGLLMGLGSRLAAGCNIANLFSGVALLSVHSFLAGAGIILGVYVMTHYMYREVGCAI
ncbi:YeeE/YedE family protein [Halorubrum sp. SS5]|uniref:YeeE/YedE family protein n=2 Tax=Halorubrum TaxID=56688 RepID=A0A7D4BS34_9EURY|nr:YeeE/YedE family protein [Halorubrum salinarum]QKG94237.1 YeeE/YedE family protein [Halorubrum salinarum]TKX87704.1 YeeE/YedE family protein [Halorubrum sp. SS5]